MKLQLEPQQGRELSPLQPHRRSLPCFINRKKWTCRRTLPLPPSPRRLLGGDKGEGVERKTQASSDKSIMECGDVFVVYGLRLELCS